MWGALDLGGHSGFLRAYQVRNNDDWSTGGSYRPRQQSLKSIAMDAAATAGSDASVSLKADDADSQTRWPCAMRR